MIDKTAEKPALDDIASAVAQMSPNVPVSTPAAETPATPPTPAAAAPPVTTEAPATPPAPAQAPVSATPAPTVDPEALAKRLKDKDDFIIRLQEENRQKDSLMQSQMAEALQKQTQISEAMHEQLKLMQPQLSPEQRQELITAQLIKLNQDPEGFLKDSGLGKQVGTMMEKLAAAERRIEELSAPVSEITPQLVYQRIIGSLAEKSPEVLTPEFQAAMKSKELTTKVYNENFADQDAEQVFKDPTFWKLLVLETKLQAAAGMKPQLAQAGQDLANQAAIAKAGAAIGTPPGGPSGPAPVKPSTASDKLVEDMFSMTPGSRALNLDGLFKKK